MCRYSRIEGVISLSCSGVIVVMFTAEFKIFNMGINVAALVSAHLVILTREEKLDTGSLDAANRLNKYGTYFSNTVLLANWDSKVWKQLWMR